MEWMEILNQIFDLCIVPLLGILVTCLVVFISSKTKELNEKHDVELLTKYTNMLSQTVIDCVIATNQTYVEALKGQNKFDAEAQKKAFEMTYQSVLQVLNEDAKDYLSNVYGDISILLTNLIEAEVSRNKV